MTLIIHISTQTLTHFESGHEVGHYPVSTAVKGVGEENGSEKTPRGWHIIRAKIGAHARTNAVFVDRRPTGEIFDAALRERFPNRDWILTRILWLSGTELGKNRLGMVDTMSRFIYIHGCPDDTVMGVPGSKGCIRMRNSDIIKLFDQVKVQDRVYIE